VTAFGARASFFSVATWMLTRVATLAVVESEDTRIVLQQTIAGGQDDDGAQRLQLPMTSIA
jgi:hypothetical protein